MRHRDQAHVGLLRFLHGHCRLGRVGDAHERFTAVHHGDDDVVARGGLHEHVHARLFGQYLRHGGGRGVVETSRWQRGETDRLRECSRGNHAGRGERGKIFVAHLSSCGRASLAQSTEMPRLFTNGTQNFWSSRMVRAMSSGVPAPSSMPLSTKRFATSVVCRVLTSSAESRLTISRGVPAGTASPCQKYTSKSG